MSHGTFTLHFGVIDRRAPMEHTAHDALVPLAGPYGGEFLAPDHTRYHHAYDSFSQWGEKVGDAGERLPTWGEPLHVTCEIEASHTSAREYVREYLALLEELVTPLGLSVCDYAVLTESDDYTQGSEIHGRFA